METTHRPARAGHRFWRLLLLATFLASGGNAAFAAADPDSVQFTLEGCKFVNNTNTPLASFNFVCSDSAYTTGNLGSGWNELDLVPHRTTVHAGNSAPATQTYAFANVLDGIDVGKPGYDIISAPVLNTALSSASCTAASTGGQQSLTPGAGGIDTSIYRIWTVTQLKNTTCVYDWYGRLAVGSHLWPGSSLHADLLNQSFTTAGIGAKEVSIPVKEIKAQSLNKDMSAVENATVTWELTKEGSPANVDFGDVCAADAPTSQPATITVTWTKSAATPDGITVTTHVYATNPAARTVQVTVTDVIYQGTTQTTALDTASSALTDLPANSTTLVLTHTALLPASDGNIGDFLNDVATGTYMDPVTHVAIPGTTTATAQTQITQGTVSNGSAVIDDTESITGTGLTFSVPTPPSSGSFLNGYDGSATTGPVDWLSSAQTSSGSITFDKTIYMTGLLVTSGTLSDTAHLTSTSQSLSAQASITTSSTATVKLTVSKTIPAEYPGAFLNGAGDLLKVHFHVAGALGYSNDFTLTFDGSTPCDASGCTLSTDLPGLTPDTFTVTETSSELCPLGTCTNPATNSFLSPASNPLQKDLTIPADGNMTGRCSGTVAFTNILNALGVKAEVQKITVPALASDDPDYLWTFTLNGPNVSTCLPATVGAGAGFVTFTEASGVDPCLLSDGDYTVTETTKLGWKEDGATPNDGVDTLVCAFSVDLIADDGKTFSCTFHNTKLAHASLLKTVNHVPDQSATDAFTFQLRTGATLDSVGTIIETGIANLADLFQIAFQTLLDPGTTYQFCEIVMPGWTTDLPGAFVPGGNLPNPDNSVQCVNFTPTPGEVKLFTVDNEPPPEVLSGRTIGFWKNWASCRESRGRQEPVLDETLVAATPPGIQVGSFYIVSGQCTYAVNLLNKSAMTTGAKKPGDPLFNMVAQLIAAELNIVAGDVACPKVTAAIVAANNLLIKYNFTGDGYTGTLSKADRQLATSLATELDLYNNDNPSACQ